MGAAASSARAGSPIQPEAARPDSAAATLRVETIPPGLLVVIDGVHAGRSPVGPVWVAAKPVHIQAVADDPRRFEPGRNSVVMSPRPGDALTAVLDLRPSVLLRTSPEPALLFLEEAGSTGRDSSLGATPQWLLPARIERRSIRLAAADHADTVVSGSDLLRWSEGSDRGVTVALRRVRPMLPPAPPVKPPVYRRRWVQFALIGAGAALTGVAALLRNQGDRWYDRYLASSDPDEISRSYDRTSHYDRLAGASLGTGQALATAGILLLVTTPSR